MKRHFTVIISALAAIILMAVPVTAQTPVYHEDPGQARMLFSGISLLRYYASSLESIEQRKPEIAESRLNKMPFTNMPPELENSKEKVASCGIELAFSLTRLWGIREEQNILLGQFRLVEALEMEEQITRGLPKAKSALNQLADIVEETGRYLKVDTPAAGQELKQAYEEVKELIQRLREMLDLLGRPVLDKNSLGEIWGTTDPEDWQKLMKPTGLSLEAEPQSAFVGEEITFHGRLTSQGQPLAERPVVILLEKSEAITVRTDAGGYYRGKLALPYRYTEEIELQAVYHPQDRDTGVYLGSTSPVVKISVLFFSAQLDIRVEGPAYPGREAVVHGMFDYGTSPEHGSREVEIYLDGQTAGRFSAGTSFTRAFKLDDRITLGEHTLTVSAPADGKYAPVLASVLMNVRRAEVRVEMDLPGLAVIPGTLDVSGRAYSEAGPLEGASINIRTGGNSVQTTTLPDGTFRMEIRNGVELSLLGYQELIVQVSPQEPWNALATATERVFIINILSCSGLALIIAITGIFVPRRWKRKEVSQKRATLQQPVRAPGMTGEGVTAGKLAGQPQAISERAEAGGTLGYWYRLALKAVQRITNLVLRPGQTLREYARETGPRLGRAGQPFRDLTELMERSLYAPWQPGREDLEKGEKLSRQVAEEGGNEDL
jgi:hypothetical protein